MKQQTPGWKIEIENLGRLPRCRGGRIDRASRQPQRACRRSGASRPGAPRLLHSAQRAARVLRCRDALGRQAAPAGKLARADIRRTRLRCGLMNNE